MVIPRKMAWGIVHPIWANGCLGRLWLQGRQQALLERTGGVLGDCWGSLTCRAGDLVVALAWRPKWGPPSQWLNFFLPGGGLQWLGRQQALLARSQLVQGACLEECWELQNIDLGQNT